MGWNLSNMFSGAISGASLGAGLGPIGAIAGAVGGGILGGTQGSEASSAAKEQYNYTLGLQNHNQDWQTYMSNTSHQREVKDLEAAGLNPVLSAMGGNGASTGTPGGGTVGMPDKVAEKTAKMQNTLGLMTLANELSNSAKLRQQTDANIAKIKTDTELAPQMAMADVALKGAQAGSAKARATYDTIMAKADKDLKDAETKNKRADTVQKVSNLIGTEETETSIPWFFKHKSKRSTNSAKQVRELLEAM